MNNFGACKTTIDMWVPNTLGQSFWGYGIGSTGGNMTEGLYCPAALKPFPSIFPSIALDLHRCTKVLSGTFPNNISALLHLR